ncbi:acyltransferase family protein [Streptosporangium roseum]|uniref:acyltransferase family protein n=1 Tax=Streptosporangium roseum TaxID=2001 RepID=UPI0004CCFDF0|nr:acyltransferase [Streptosporangium roseum]
MRRQARRLAERTPPQRERHVDLLRAVAIVAVVVGHWLAIYVTHDSRGFQGGNILRVVPWARPLTWPFQVMPLFFLVGGFANAASLTSHLRRGGSSTDWVLGRAARLLRPTTTLLGGLAVAAATAGLLGADPALIGVAVWLASIPLWFLVAYIAVVVLTPPMYALHRRAGLAVPIVLAVLVGVGDLTRLALAVPYVGKANFLLAWLAVHQLGFAWQDGRLPSRRSVAAPMTVAGFTALVLLTVVGPYPVSMVGFEGERVQNTSPPTLALLALAVTQAGIALWTRDRGNRWMRRPGPWTVVVAVNSVIMTLFLWHMTAVVIGVPALYGTAVMPDATPGSGLWLLLRIPWLAFLALILALLVAVFGRFEQRAGSRTAPAAPVRGVLPAALTVAGIVAVIAALLGLALAGSGYHGPVGLPVGMVAAYAGGVAVLGLVRRRYARPARD